ncbi:uncharacterized protein Z520_05880 [Fonsecaea multimorphosa CBS 102226]|uniref:Metallo-beta-lactamase domain-containing protein n=1 Tax=Fonsecaea multimorphosa CBS 102226 TaxID=1442371 RepID=A0A0D2K5Y1_9EURO|nr:uncharacterized protein Z520_05880 [Fonsecaea multimorphosa CBS 102226]KIX98579.1 hypothetical protein Z520_05880 [Fonsecaea multimorphosa CBS 102226]OAL24771.1 hypothetical protein AYO22_05560 [Fonsecaea multimorphosa]
MASGNQPIFPVPSGVAANLSIINTTGTIQGMAADHLVKPTLPGFHMFPKVPSWSFLIETTVSGKTRKVLFDLGIPKDVYALPPLVSDRLKTFKWVVDVPQSTAEVLVEHGTHLADIEAVVWSHWHWDHQGDIQHFPSTTDLVVGPGFSKAFLPAYPAGPKSPIRQTDLDGRRLREITFDESGTVQIGQIRAFDYFGDGSFYLLDTPGHAIGHLAGLVRTTSNPDTFAFLGGDLTHHGGELRPSKYLDFASAAASLGAEAEKAAATVQTLESLQTSRGRRVDQPFFDPVITSDFDEAVRTIVRAQDADGQDNIFFLAAHDDTIDGVVDVYPKRANDWKARGWREKTLWTFLRDFREALRDGSGSHPPVLQCPGHSSS